MTWMESDFQEKMQGNFDSPLPFLLTEALEFLLFSLWKSS